MCDIVLLVYDQLEYTKKCIESIFNNTDYPYKLIIVDNGSVKKETVEYLDLVALKNSDKVIIVRNKENQGYVKAVNKGLENTSSEFVCVMSNDTIAYPGWLTQMVIIAQKDKKIGIVNPLWELPKRITRNKPKISFKVINKYFENVVKKQKNTFIETDWARGFCYLTKREVIDKIGGLDLDFSPGYYDDWDYSMRAIKAGYICVRASGAFVWHYKNITYGNELGYQGLNKALEDKAKIFYPRWGKPLRLLLVNSDNSSEFNNLIGDLLRDQNMLTVINSNKKFKFDHTNLILKNSIQYLLFIKIGFSLLDNFRHNKSKRYNLIICNKKIQEILKKFKFIQENYKFVVLNKDYKSKEKISEVKQYKNYSY